MKNFIHILSRWYLHHIQCIPLYQYMFDKNWLVVWNMFYCPCHNKGMSSETHWRTLHIFQDGQLKRPTRLIFPLIAWWIFPHQVDFPWAHCSNQKTPSQSFPCWTRGPGSHGKKSLGKFHHDTSFSRARVNHKLREIIPFYGRTIFGWVTYDNLINLPRNMNVMNSLSMEMVVDHFYVQFLYG